MIEILLFGLIVGFGLGIFAGFFIKTIIERKFKDYSGTIFVHRDKVSEKTVYSLELYDYPEKLEFKKVVIFKVDSLDRD